MDDLISRQAALDAIDKNSGALLSCGRTGPEHILVHYGRRVIEELPSAERKKGKWKEADDGWDGEYFVCSECGCPWTLIEGTPEENGMNFCPNCGAEMRGEEE